MARTCLILVVDDDADVRAALFGSLEGQGHEVVCVKNGQEALAYLRSEARRPELVLLDTAMPVMDGAALRACQLLDPALASIPVVLLSADEIADDARLAGLPAVRKPLRLDDVAQLVRSHCAGL